MIRARARQWVLSLGLVSATYVIAGPWLSGQRSVSSSGVPALRSGLPWAPEYLDRSRIDRQSVRTTRLVDTILIPTIGFPARLEEERVLRIYLSKRPDPRWKMVLLERSQIASIDRLLYAVPPATNARELLEERLAEAKENRKNAQARHTARRTRRETAGLDQVYASAVSEGIAALEQRIAGVKKEVEQIARGTHAEVLVWDGRVDALLDPIYAIDVAAPKELAPGLYSLVILDEQRSLVDLQLNSAYLPRDPRAKKFDLVVAADWQWGRKRAVAASVVEWVSFMNGLAGEANAPELIILAGDIVDGQYGSAAGVTGQLFGGAADYPRDFLQAWLALAALRIPTYVQPGNHDGYRFDGMLGDTMVDGLLLFEATFGPQYFSFDRGDLRFIQINSYDLPGEYRTSRRSSSSTIFEHVSDKLNVLNWGGGMQDAQYRWLVGQLELADPPKIRRNKIIVSHHDPRGSYPALKPGTADPDDIWSTQRHFPITGDRTDRGATLATRAPHFQDTVATHIGYYTPLRRTSSPIRSKEWFDLGLSPVPPPTLGFPGWLRYEHIWHSELIYVGDLDDRAPFEVDERMISPGKLLAAIRDAEVRTMFVAHNNRFCLERMSAGESIFTRESADSLAVFGDQRTRSVLERTKLRVPLEVHHVADIADFESEGHGFFWVEANGAEITSYEIDHL